MNKKNIFHALSVVAVAGLTLTACDKSAPKMDEQPAKTSTSVTGEMKIAYVEVDSLMSQYKFCKDFTAILQKKSNNARNTLNQKRPKIASCSSKLPAEIK